MKYRHLWLSPLIFFSVYLVVFTGLLGKEFLSSLLTGSGIALSMLLFNWIGWTMMEKRKAKRIKN